MQCIEFLYICSFCINLLSITMNGYNRYKTNWFTNTEQIHTFSSKQIKLKSFTMYCTFLKRSLSRINANICLLCHVILLFLCYCPVKILGGFVCTSTILLGTYLSPINICIDQFYPSKFRILIFKVNKNYILLYFTSFTLFYLVNIDLILP